MDWISCPCADETSSILPDRGPSLGPSSRMTLVCPMHHFHFPRRGTEDPSSRLDTHMTGRHDLDAKCRSTLEPHILLRPYFYGWMSTLYGFSKMLTRSMKSSWTCTAVSRSTFVSHGACWLFSAWDFGFMSVSSCLHLIQMVDKTHST